MARKKIAPFKSAAEREERIARMVKTLCRTCEEQTAPDRQRWEKAADLFAGKQDFGPLRQENEALAQVFMHVFSKIVRSGASAIQDIIHGSADFFDLDPPAGEEPTVFTNVVEKMVRYRIEQLRLPQHTYKFGINGGIFGLGVNKLWLDRRVEKKPEIVAEEKRIQVEGENSALGSKVEKPDEMLPEDEYGIQQELMSVFDEFFGKEQPSRIKRDIKVQKKLKYTYKIRTIEPGNYFFEPTVDDAKDSPWRAERSFVKYFQLHPLFESGVLDKSKKKELLQKRGPRTTSTGSPVTVSSSAEGHAFKRKDQYPAANEYAPEIEMFEYFGPLIASGDEEGYEAGDIIEEDCWFVVTDSDLVLKDAKCPFWFADSPYYESVFCPMPSKAVGAGIADNAMDQQMLINQIWSLYMDHLTFTILGVKGLNVDALEDPSQVAAGLVPGQTLLFNGTQKVSDAIGDIDYNPNLAFPIVQVMEKLELAGQSAAGVDVTSANPTSRARISAKEVTANQERSDRSQFSLARELDASYIEETVRRVLGMVLQFDFEGPILKEYVEEGVITRAEHEVISEYTRLERFKEASRNYKIRVKGFRDRLERNDELSRMVEFIQQLNQIPESRDKVNWGELIEVLSEKFNVPAERIIFDVTPQDKAREENAMLKDSRAVAVLDVDRHPIHLALHYEQVMKNPNDATKAHIMSHIQYAQMSGVDIPPPPPEVAELMGLQQAPVEESQQLQ